MHLIYKVLLASMYYLGFGIGGYTFIFRHASHATALAGRVWPGELSSPEYDGMEALRIKIELCNREYRLV